MESQPELIVLDTETTGLEQPIGVVEVAYARINESLEAVEEFDALVDPCLPISPGATEVHGITEADVTGQPSLSTALRFISNKPCVLIGHNVQFDYKLVIDHLDVVGTLCTLALARQYIQGAPNYKLATLQSYLGLPNFESHRALGDVFTTLNLLRLILHRYNLDINKVIKRQEMPRMLMYMPYGKHQGRLMTEVPRDYRAWLLGAGNLDQDLLYTLKKLEHI